MSHGGSERIGPPAAIDRLLEPLERFLHVEAAGGIVLLACTVVALVAANSPFAEAYGHFWHTDVAIAFGTRELRMSLAHWINDGLMVLFFFVVGLEVKRELVLGELRDPRRAALPIVAAVGGMVVPAAVYLVLQAGTPTARGWGIPMATDIAFVVGCMALLGNRIAHGLRVMLLTLAIVDDIGAILVIALGYATGVDVTALAIAAGGIAAVLVLQRLGVRSLAVYTIVGLGIWLAVLHSGVHATIAGVLLGLLTPARPLLSPDDSARLLTAGGDALGRDPDSARAAQVRLVRQAAREAVSPVEYLERVLHPWVGFLVMPVFALANAGVPIAVDDLRDPVAVAVAAGLVIGKPLGVVGASRLAVAAGLARLPDGVGWPALVGGGFLAGIGFTMALFIAGLALPAASDPAKVGILVASLVAAVAGMLTLLAVTERPPPRNGTGRTPAHLGG